MNIIKIKDIRANAIIGVYDWEKQQKQPVLINIEIEYDVTEAVQSDSIENALDYCELTKNIVKKVEESKFELLEKLVDYVSAIVMEHPRAKKSKVEIDKTEVLKEYADSVSVTKIV